MTAMTLLTAGCMLVVLAPAVLGDGYGHGHGGYGHSSHGEGTACIVKVLRINQALGDSFFFTFN